MKDKMLQSTNLLMRFLPLHTLASLVMALGGSSQYIAVGAALLGAMLLCLLFRSFVKNGMVFVLLHGAVLAASPVFFGGFAAIVSLGATAAVTADSMLMRFRKREIKGYGELLIWLFVLCFFIAAYFKKTDFLPLCTIEAVLFIAVKFMFNGELATGEFLEVNKNVADMPVSAIKKRTGMFLVIFALLAIFGMAVGINSGLPEILENAAKSVFGMLEGIFGRENEIESSQMDFSVFSDAPLPDVSGLNLETGRKLPPIFQSIGKILIYTLLGMAVVAAVRLVIIRMRDFLAGLYDTKHENEKSEFVLPDKEKFVMKSRRAASFKDSMPNDAKIRRLYKKYVMKNKKEELSGALTPVEISKKRKTAESCADDKIRSIYEKAKYSQAECTRDEVAEMKQMVKNGGRKSGK